jgi:hypothetical protein
MPFGPLRPHKQSLNPQDVTFLPITHNHEQEGNPPSSSSQGQVRLPQHVTPQGPTQIVHDPQQSHKTSSPQARVTLTNPSAIRRSPFDRYKRKAAPEPKFNPYRFVHQKFGLSEAAFDAQVDQEIDELLQEIDSTRRHELLETLSEERALTKRDCRDLFKHSVLSPTGSLLGVLAWANSLDDDPPDDS